MVLFLIFGAFIVSDEADACIHARCWAAVTGCEEKENRGREFCRRVEHWLEVFEEQLPCCFALV